MYYACGCDAAPLSIPEPFLAIQKGETLAFFPRGGSGRQEAYLYACGFDAAPSSIPEPFLAIQKGETLAFFPRGGEEFWTSGSICTRLWVERCAPLNTGTILGHSQGGSTVFGTACVKLPQETHDITKTTNNKFLSRCLITAMAAGHVHGHGFLPWPCHGCQPWPWLRIMALPAGLGCRPWPMAHGPWPMAHGPWPWPWPSSCEDRQRDLFFDGFRDLMRLPQETHETTNNAKQ